MVVLALAATLFLLNSLFSSWDAEWLKMARQWRLSKANTKEEGLFDGADGMDDFYVWAPGVMELESRVESSKGVQVSRLIAVADRHIKDTEVHSVVLKQWIPSSASPHNYVSISKYYWPVAGNPEAPWVRNPGAINPEATKISDYVLFRKTSNGVTAMSLAYQFGINHPRREQYREKATSRIKEWFCDEETKMFPDLWFGSIVRNKPSHDLTKTAWAKVKEMGSKEGILDLWPIAPLLHSVKGLGLDMSTQDCLVDWVGEYIKFHETSPLAYNERNTKNNHATYYDVQFLSLLAYTSNTTGIHAYLKKITIPRLISQVQSNGHQAEELARPTSWFYSLFNMRGWCYLALLAEDSGIDLWGVKPEGWNYPVIQTALTFILENKFSNPPGLAWPRNDTRKDWALPGFLASQFYHAAKAYQVWDKTDEMSIKWQNWIQLIEKENARD